MRRRTALIWMGLDAPGTDTWAITADKGVLYTLTDPVKLNTWGQERFTEPKRVRMRGQSLSNLHRGCMRCYSHYLSWNALLDQVALCGRRNTGIYNDYGWIVVPIDDFNLAPTRPNYHFFTTVSKNSTWLGPKPVWVIDISYNVSNRKWGVFVGERWKKVHPQRNSHKPYCYYGHIP